MSYFRTEFGFIAYRNSGKIVAVLADPICHHKHKAHIWDAFLEKYPNCIIVNCSLESATYLQTKGLHILPFGEEHHINPKTFRLNWRYHKSIKRSVNYYQKNGAKVAELHDIGSYVDEIKALQKKWLKSRRSHSEYQYFLTRPLNLEHQKDVRHFVLLENDELKAYAQFDPIYNKGYYLSQSLFDPTANQSLIKALIVGVSDILKKEDVQLLSLGLSPFCFTYRPQFMSLRSSIVNRLACSIGQFIYNFKGLYQMKSSFKSELNPVFIASTSKYPVREFMAVKKIVLGVIEDINR